MTSQFHIVAEELVRRLKPSRLKLGGGVEGGLEGGVGARTSRSAADREQEFRVEGLGMPD